MIQIAVCDDNGEYRNRIRSILEKYFADRQMECQVQLFESGEEVCEYGQDIEQFQLVLLDVELGYGKINGIETAEQIRRWSRTVTICFVTEFISYVLEGYPVRAFRYILKDELESHIYDCLDALLAEWELCSKETAAVTVRCGKETRELPVRNICYIESDRHNLKCYLQTDSGYDEIVFREKLDDFAKRMSHPCLVRVQKSFLVNAHYAEKIQRYGMLMRNGVWINIPKDRYCAVRDACRKYMKSV